jgi:hypothetical protein
MTQCKLSCDTLHFYRVAHYLLVGVIAVLVMGSIIAVARLRFDVECALSKREQERRNIMEKERERSQQNSSPEVDVSSLQNPTLTFPRQLKSTLIGRR